MSRAILFSSLCVPCCFFLHLRVDFFLWQVQPPLSFSSFSWLNHHHGTCRFKLAACIGLYFGLKVLSLSLSLSLPSLRHMWVETQSRVVFSLVQKFSTVHSSSQEAREKERERERIVLLAILGILAKRWGQSRRPVKLVISVYRGCKVEDTTWLINATHWSILTCFWRLEFLRRTQRLTGSLMKRDIFFFQSSLNSHLSVWIWNTPWILGTLFFSLSLSLSLSSYIPLLVYMYVCDWCKCNFSLFLPNPR